MRFSAALTALVIALGLFALPANTPSATAHPLGNFSINRLSVLDINGDGTLSLTYIVDMAEIPTFQARDAIDPDGDGVLSEAESRAYLQGEAPRLLANLSLEVDGARVALQLLASNVELLEGQGGLQTARIVIEARGVLPEDWQAAATARYEDRNFEGTNGWRDVVVRPGSGVDLFESTASTADVTRGLTAYPEDQLKSPPAATSASFRLRAGETTTIGARPATPAGDTVARDEADRTLGRFASLVATEKLTPAVIALALVLAAGWGAMHALGPGHGKTVVAAYLVGERGTGRHALYLGLIVTATHTISVFALGAIAILASDIVAADDIYFWLSLGSGLLVAFLGGTLLLGRVRRLVAGFGSAGHDMQAHTHDHGHHHEHDHDQPQEHSHNHDGAHEHTHNHDGAHEHLHCHEHACAREHAHGHEHPALQNEHLHDDRVGWVAEARRAAVGAGLAPVPAAAASDQHSQAEHGGHEHAHGHHVDHGHAHGPDHQHGHSHVPTQPGWRGIVALGIAGGIVPCPTALVVMLGAIALDRAVLGLVLVTAFSIGLAGVLTGVGLLVVYGKRWLAARRLPVMAGGLARRAQLVAPVLSALTILGVGLVLTGQALL